MLHYINYLFLRITVWVIGILPWSTFYRLSDLLAWILRVPVGYRKKVITKNITNSFPDYNTSQIDDIVRKSYGNLADVLLEGLRGFTISSHEVNRRYIFKNPALIDRYFKEGKHVIGLASHYGNWEWGTQTIGHQLMHRTLGIVKLVKNPYLNDYLQRTRCAHNVHVADIGRTSAAIQEFEDEPTLFLFISDQGPRNVQKAQWVQFLNQRTPCLYGADRLARKKNWPVINIKTERTKRGFYELELELIEELPELTQDGAITTKYMTSLEKQIIAKPEDWLWSHRRWKRAHINV